MKIKLVILLVGLVLIALSCKERPSWEVLINDYVNQSEAAKVNIQSIEKLGVVLASDSLELYCQEFNSEENKLDVLSTDHILNTCEETMQIYSDIIDELSEKVDSLQQSVNKIDEKENDKGQIYEDLITYSEYDIYTGSLQRCRDLKSKYQHLYNRLNTYKARPDSILASRYQCIFVEATIANDTVPSISKTFLLNPQGDKILAVLEN